MTTLPIQTLTIALPDGSTLSVEVDPTFIAGAYSTTATYKTVTWNLANGQASLKLVPSLKPAPSPAPKNTTPPLMEGASAVGDGIISSPGTWSGAASVSTQLRRNGVNVGSPNQYTSWANAYVIQSADQGASFDCVDVATSSGGTKSNPVASSNKILVPAAPVPTPTPSPSPSPSDPPTSFVVPAGWHTPNMFANVAHDWDFTQGSVPSGWVVNTGGDPAGANLQTPPTYFTNTPQTIRLDSNGLGLGVARDTTLGGYQAGWVDTGGSYAPAPNQHISILIQSPPTGALWLAAWVRGQRLKFGDGGNYQEFDIFELLTWQLRQWYTTVHYWPANSPNVNIPNWPFDPGVDPSTQAAWVDFFWEMLSDGPCVTTAYAGKVVAQQRALPSVFGATPSGSVNKLVLSNGASTGKWTGPALSSANDGNLPQFMVVKRVVVRD